MLPSSNSVSTGAYERLGKKNYKAKICDEFKLGERARVAKTFDKEFFLDVLDQLC